MGSRGASSSVTKALNMSLAERVYRSMSFWERNFTANQNQAIRMSTAPSDISMIGETEKAIQVQFATDYGNLKTWIPKSVISDEAMERNMKYTAERERRKTEAFANHQKLVNYAKSQGVKVTSRTKTSTIYKKMREAGIAIPKGI